MPSNNLAVASNVMVDNVDLGESPTVRTARDGTDIMNSIVIEQSTHNQSVVNQNQDATTVTSVTAAVTNNNNYSVSSLSDKQFLALIRRLDAVVQRLQRENDRLVSESQFANRHLQNYQDLLCDLRKIWYTVSPTLRGVARTYFQRRGLDLNQPYRLCEDQSLLPEMEENNDLAQLEDVEQVVEKSEWTKRMVQQKSTPSRQNQPSGLFGFLGAFFACTNRHFDEDHSPSQNQQTQSLSVKKDGSLSQANSVRSCIHDQVVTGPTVSASARPSSGTFTQFKNQQNVLGSVQTGNQITVNSGSESERQQQVNIVNSSSDAKNVNNDTNVNDLSMSNDNLSKDSTNSLEKQLTSRTLSVLQNIESGFYDETMSKRRKVGQTRKPKQPLSGRSNSNSNISNNQVNQQSTDEEIKQNYRSSQAAPKPIIEEEDDEEENDDSQGTTSILNQKKLLTGTDLAKMRPLALHTLPPRYPNAQPFPIKKLNSGSEDLNLNGTNDIDNDDIDDQNSHDSRNQSARNSNTNKMPDSARNKILSNFQQNHNQDDDEDNSPPPTSMNTARRRVQQDRDLINGVSTLNILATPKEITAETPQLMINSELTELQLNQQSDLNVNENGCLSARGNRSNPNNNSNPNSNCNSKNNSKTRNSGSNNLLSTIAPSEPTQVEWFTAKYIDSPSPSPGRTLNSHRGGDWSARSGDIHLTGIKEEGIGDLSKDTSSYNNQGEDSNENENSESRSLKEDKDSKNTNSIKLMEKAVHGGQSPRGKSPRIEHPDPGMQILLNTCSLDDFYAGLEERESEMKGSNSNLRGYIGNNNSFDTRTAYSSPDRNQQLLGSNQLNLMSTNLNQTNFCGTGPDTARYHAIDLQDNDCLTDGNKSQSSRSGNSEDDEISEGGSQQSGRDSDELRSIEGEEQIQKTEGMTPVDGAQGEGAVSSTSFQQFRPTSDSLATASASRPSCRHSISGGSKRRPSNINKANTTTSTSATGTGHWDSSSSNSKSKSQQKGTIELDHVYWSKTLDWIAEVELKNVALEQQVLKLRTALREIEVLGVGVRKEDSTKSDNVSQVDTKVDVLISTQSQQQQNDSNMNNNNNNHQSDLELQLTLAREQVKELEQKFADVQAEWMKVGDQAKKRRTTSKESKTKKSSTSSGKGKTQNQIIKNAQNVGSGNQQFGDENQVDINSSKKSNNSKTTSNNSVSETTRSSRSPKNDNSQRDRTDHVNSPNTNENNNVNVNHSNTTSSNTLLNDDSVPKIPSDDNFSHEFNIIDTGHQKYLEELVKINSSENQEDEDSGHQFYDKETNGAQINVYSINIVKRDNFRLGSTELINDNNTKAISQSSNNVQYNENQNQLQSNQSLQDHQQNQQYFSNQNDNQTVLNNVNDNNIILKFDSDSVSTHIKDNRPTYPNLDTQKLEIHSTIPDDQDPFKAAYWARPLSDKEEEQKEDVEKNINDNDNIDNITFTVPGRQDRVLLTASPARIGQKRKKNVEKDNKTQIQPTDIVTASPALNFGYNNDFRGYHVPGDLNYQSATNGIVNAVQQYQIQNNDNQAFNNIGDKDKRLLSSGRTTWGPASPGPVSSQFLNNQSEFLLTSQQYQQQQTVVQNNNQVLASPKSRSPCPQHRSPISSKESLFLMGNQTSINRITRSQQSSTRSTDNSQKSKSLSAQESLDSQQQVPEIPRVVSSDVCIIKEQDQDDNDKVQESRLPSQIPVVDYNDSSVAQTSALVSKSDTGMNNIKDQSSPRNQVSGNSKTKKPSRNTKGTKIQNNKR